MKVDIIAVGKLKERFWREACAEYGKRLTRYLDVNIVELDDKDPARYGGEEKAREAEGIEIERAVERSAAPSDRYVACLDIDGELVTSEDLARLVEERQVEGCKKLVFVIGGSTGIDDAVKRRAQARISFGKITLPHNLARVVLLEQIYRACKINAGEPYHK